MDTVYTLQRDHLGPHSTIGHIIGPDITHVYTCEDVVREPATAPGVSDHGVIDAWVRSWKVHGKTAIPYGRYRLAWTFSGRFKRHTLELLSVPGYGGIRIHPGNTAADTEGCILPGLSARGLPPEEVLSSRQAVAKLEATICPRIERGEHVYLNIVRPL